MTYSEDTLVQQTTADYLRDELGWESIYAYDQENYGENSLLGRTNRKQTVVHQINVGWYGERAIFNLKQLYGLSSVWSR
jgi:hypothetical protein